MRRLAEMLPVQFRVLYRQFLLRIFDFEALSIQADIPRFLGQFASVLVFCSLIGALGMLTSGDANNGPEAASAFPWRIEQSLISGMMFVTGLIAVVSWDSIFPDRRDVMVLAPLPLTTRPILFAKISASASLVGLGILALNFATGIVWPLLLGSQHNAYWGWFQSFAAYWFTMAGASLFVFFSVLSVQGITALFLPRRLFLVISGALQITAFALVFGGYFLEPSLATPAAMGLAENHWVLACNPTFWFFGLFNQINGTLPEPFMWLAWRAWIGLAIVVLGAILSLTLCYWRTMRKTVEEPDLIPGSRRLRFTPRFGSSLLGAVVLFCARSILRSRQHRLVLSFYFAVISSIALFWLRIELSTREYIPLSADYLVATLVMMAFAIFGLRNTFSLPISLTANWIWRTTQLSPPEKYIGGTRWSLLLLAVLPVWLISALLSIRLRPISHIVTHLAVLILVGWILVELALIGLSKVPFTCSYLPGKVHFQVMLWSGLALMVVFALSAAELEFPALADRSRCIVMLVFLAIAALALYWFNRHRAKNLCLLFEELPVEAITTLWLVTRASPGAASSRT